jgi:hypothetical protein
VVTFSVDWTLLDPRDALSTSEARTLIRKILIDGEVLFTRHAKDEMAEDDLDANDCRNVLRGGVVDPPELHGSGYSWRYRVHTSKIWVVVTFASETRLFVVTAWRV